MCVIRSPVEFSIGHFLFTWYHVFMRKKRKKATIRAYQCKTKSLSGHRFVDIIPQARKLLRALQKQTKRRSYVRSTYFHKDKIFFDFFWQHMQGKSVVDRARRLKYLSCALELLQKSRIDPITFMDENHPGVIKHEFRGNAPDGTIFSVIVQEDRKTNRKQLLTLYPAQLK